MVSSYAYQYTVKETGSGFLKRDKHWSYTKTGIIGAQTNFFMIPEDNPYFEISKYYDDNFGRKVIYDKANLNIWYV
ncbi:MAG TPA: hypothetical protein VJY66_03445 [Acholeplasma sp.]|nr:hypothetical protein [Acholeplasma sp.]